MVAVYDNDGDNYNGDHGDDHYNHDCDGDGLSEILDFNLNLYIF